MSIINAQTISSQAAGLAASIHAPVDNQDVSMSPTNAEQAAGPALPLSNILPPISSNVLTTISESPIVILADSSTDSLLTSSTLLSSSSDSNSSPPISKSFSYLKSTIEKHLASDTKAKAPTKRPDTPIPDLDNPIPYRRPRSLTERHPLLHRRSAITLEILDPHSLTSFGFHIGQIAVFIANDGRLRRGQPPAEFSPAAYSTFVNLFNSVAAADSMGIKFTTFDESTKKPVITGNAPRLSDFDILHDDVYPAYDSPPPAHSHTESRRSTRDSKSSTSRRSARPNGTPRLNIAKLTKDTNPRKSAAFARFGAM